MLKMDVDHPAQPAIPLIALAVLKGYIRNPLGFLVGAVFTLPRFKKRIPSHFPDEFVKSVALQTWMYIRLKEKVGVVSYLAPKGSSDPAVGSPDLAIRLEQAV